MEKEVKPMVIHLLFRKIFFKPVFGFPRRFKITKKLGEGGFAQVKHAKNRITN